MLWFQISEHRWGWKRQSRQSFLFLLPFPALRSNVVIHSWTGWYTAKKWVIKTCSIVVMLWMDWASAATKMQLSEWIPCFPLSKSKYSLEAPQRRETASLTFLTLIRTSPFGKGEQKKFLFFSFFFSEERWDNTLWALKVCVTFMSP